MAMCLNRFIDSPEFDDDDTHRVKIQPSNSNRTYICLLNENGERKIRVQSSNSNDEIEWDLDNLVENYKKSSLNIDGYYLSANDDYSVVPKKPATDGSYFVLGRNRDHQYYYMYLPKKDTSGQEKEENESLNNNEIGQEEFGAGELELDVKESTTVRYYLSTNGEDLKYIPIKSTDTLPMSCQFSIYPPPDMCGQKKIQK